MYLSFTFTFNLGVTYLLENRYIQAEANSLLAISKYKCSSLLRF